MAREPTEREALERKGFGRQGTEPLAIEPAVQRRSEPGDTHALAQGSVQTSAQTSAQVLPFRRREHADQTRHPQTTDESHEPGDEPTDDLAQFEQRDEDETVDYRQRMLMNVIAAVVVTVLVGAGIWLADTITQLQHDQDCVLQGRKNCVPIEVPTLKR